MAEGDTTAKWPSPITFDDDDPKVGYAYVTLKMKELTYDKPLIGKAKTNAEVDAKFDTENVAVTVKINTGSENIVYEYKKSLPADIIKENSEYKMKDGRVILVLCKAKKVSWAAHANHFIKK